MDYIKKDVKVKDQYDVVIAGGGTAGVIAAISAGRMGLKTLVVERLFALGGSQTLGLVMPLMPSHVPGDKSSSGIHTELVNRMHSEGHGSESGKDIGSWFDPIHLRSILEDAVMESGAEILYNTSVVDAVTEQNQIKYMMIHNKDGLSAIGAKYFIDATGDGDLAALAGVEYESGNDKGLNQSISLRFEMANVDVPKLGEYIKECGQQDWARYPGVTTDCSDTPILREFVKRKCEEGELTESDIKHFQMFSVPGKPKNVNFNSPELGNSENVIDAGFLTRKQIEAHHAVKRIAAFCVKNIPGFEEAYVSEIASLMGVRETRRVKAEYMLKCTDVWQYKKFDDAIATSNYPLDVHGATEDYRKSYMETPEDQRYYEIPYRCMVPVGVDNLLVAGRCLGADFLAHSTARVQHSCRAMGEAAGIAAKLALDNNLKFSQIDGVEVRKIMAEKGADALK